MELREVKGFKDYYASTNGSIYSRKSGKLKPLKPWLDSKGNYLMVSLSKNGKNYKRLVHRLIAEAFIEQEDGKDTVDHIDRDKQNNDVSNLRWLSQADNTRRGFSTRPCVRNFSTVALFHNGEFVRYYRSINEASRAGARDFGASETSLARHKISRGVELKPL